MDEMDRDVSIYPGSSPKLLEQPNKNPVPKAANPWSSSQKSTELASSYSRYS